MVWLAINSSAPGKQGHGVNTNREATQKWGMNHSVLLDEDGTVGRKYGAVTTPQMFVIDPKGVLVYGGALDNAPRGRVSESGQVNHLANALSDLKSGKPVQTGRTRPYGCSVKY